MFYSRQRLPISWTSVCIATVGAAFCAVQAVPQPDSILCPGTGCQLFKDFTVFGVSLWWLGVAYFLLMALLCLRRAHSLLFPVAAAALLADAALLAIMLVTAACIACLGAGLLIALLFGSLRGHYSVKNRPAALSAALLIGWSGLFIAALTFAGTEQLGSWRIAGPENAERRVYFAPSCPACRDAVAAFASNAAFYPVAEKDNDIAVIQAMSTALARGASIDRALETAIRATDQGTLTKPSFVEHPLFRLNLLRNKAEVMRLGFTQLPLIMINGMPQSLRPAAADSPDPAPVRPAGRDIYNQPPSALPPELLGNVDSCGDQSQVPCDPPQ